MGEIWRDAMVEAFRDTMTRIALLLPKVFAMVSFVLLGLVAGWVVRIVLERVTKALRADVYAERWGLQGAMSRAGFKQPVSALFGRLAFWTVFVVFAFMGIDALNLPATAGLISQLLAFFPHLLAAGLVLVIGLLLANFFAEAALIGAVNAQIREARLVANLVRWGVLIFTLAMVLTQLGIATEIVVAAFSILFGGAVLALAISLGLGGRHLAKDALERRFKHEQEHVVDELTHL